jgi:hypothetical protein
MVAAKFSICGAWGQAKRYAPGHNNIKKDQFKSELVFFI